MNADQSRPPAAGTPVGTFTLQELEGYWGDVHRQIAREQSPGAAIVEANPRLVNLFDDFGHRLGMRANLRRLGRLDGRRVLDLGCGRGRWVAEFAARGAQVTGVDWCVEALEQARRRVPQAGFARMPINDLGFSDGSFDVVNSVTVVQHLPHDVQVRAIREAARVLAPGGMLSLIELTAMQPGPHVFPRRVEGWVALAREHGFEPAGVRGCCYELVFRPYKAAVARLRAQNGNRPSNGNGLAGVGSKHGLTWRQRANRLAMTALALPAFPVELLSLVLPAGTATHAAMVFRRARD